MCEERRHDRRDDGLELPFPLERLRGRVVACGCGAPLAVFRRRRFYALRADVEETPDGAVLVCRACGKRHAARELLAAERRTRRR
ncbi:MAG: hypothetical protein RMK01_13050 [Thermomicrobium sp.]|nr:hypothetical protein [Thermomicrobium sp.]